MQADQRERKERVERDYTVSGSSNIQSQRNLMASPPLTLEQQAQLLFQKCCYLRKEVMKGQALGEKKTVVEGDAMMQLHQALAMVCARASPSTDPKKPYVVKAEVVACNIDSVAMADPKQKSLPVWFAKNTAWEAKDRDYIKGLLKCLRAINEKSEPSKPNTALLLELTKLIYNFCQIKVWSSLGKLLDAIKAVEERLPCQLREYQDILKGFLRKYEDKKYEYRLTQGLAGASNFCKRHPLCMSSPQSFPQVSKRWSKLASFSACFNTLVTWAWGARSYSGYKGRYLDASQTIFADAPIERTIKDFPSEDLGKHYAPAYNNKNATERAKAIAALRPFEAPTPAAPPATGLLVHAEMHMAPLLCHHTDRPTPAPKKQYIGVSKPCCVLCFKAIRSLQGPTEVVVKGTHNKLYTNWMIPQTFKSKKVTMDPLTELAELHRHVDDLIIAELHRPQGVPGSTDSDSFAGNRNDIDAAQPAPPNV